MKPADVQLGLRANFPQFSLLVLLNAFVGGMAGMERSILPQLAENQFGITAQGALLSFIVVFGAAKAIANLFTGRLANQLGRKNLLLLGWALGAPVPFLLMFAPDWGWVLAANALLGVHQGFAWSATVIMKIDLVGERERGLAMGLNEFAGYLAVGLAAFTSAWLAVEYGLRPYPFYLGVGLSAVGLLTTAWLVRDTQAHVAAEGRAHPAARLGHVFKDTTWRDRNLGSVTLNGLVNNLNDGAVWGLLPILLAQNGLPLGQIGALAAIYPAIWGLGQLLSGRLSDFICKKDLILWGMVLQGLALLGMIWANQFWSFAALLALLGWGTAMVYPTFLAAVAENTHPLDRARSLSVFRFWRDMGYAFGAVLTGYLADFVGITAVFVGIGALTALAGQWAAWRMHCRTDSVRMRAWLSQPARRRHFFQS
jgi:MFS family permease